MFDRAEYKLKSTLGACHVPDGDKRLGGDSTQSVLLFRRQSQDKLYKRRVMVAAIAFVVNAGLSSVLSLPTIPPKTGISGGPRVLWEDGALGIFLRVT